MTDTPFIHQINDAKTIFNDAKTIINHAYQEYLELIAKHLIEIIKKGKNLIIL